MKNFIDLTGKLFGKWKVIQHVKREKGRTYYLCECECGFHSFVNYYHLVGGRSTKCKTCHNSEAVKKRPMKHGNAIGRKSTPEYNCWISMRNRCNNSNDEHWKNYGERGIKICDQWEDFSVFLKDMGIRPKNHTLDRIDVDGNYCPENCRWATVKTQCENKRNNVFFEYNGIKKTKTRWSKDLGIPFTSFSRMIKKFGWPIPQLIKDNQCLG
jgi:hypothetical protein